jgi:hypothetical protein
MLSVLYCLASTVVSWGQCGGAQGLAGRVNDARSTQQRNACPLGRASVAHSRANGDTVAAGVENARNHGLPPRQRGFFTPKFCRALLEHAAPVLGRMAAAATPGTRSDLRVFASCPPQPTPAHEKRSRWPRRLPETHGPCTSTSTSPRQATTA